MGLTVTPNASRVLTVSTKLSMTLASSRSVVVAMEPEPKELIVKIMAMPSVLLAILDIF